MAQDIAFPGFISPLHSVGTIVEAVMLNINVLAQTNELLEVTLAWKAWHGEDAIDQWVTIALSEVLGHGVSKGNPRA